MKNFKQWCKTNQLAIFLFLLCTVSLGAGIGIGVNIESPPTFLLQHQKIYVHTVDTVRLVKMTNYQADEKQTDARPFETSSGITISPNMYWTIDQKFGYCAISRDIMEWNHLKYLDTLYCNLEGKIYGFIVIDKKGPDIHRSVDILTNYKSEETDITTKIWFNH